MMVEFKLKAAHFNFNASKRNINKLVTHIKAITSPPAKKETALSRTQVRQDLR